MFKDIYITFTEFLRTFGAMQLFFLRLLAASPAIFVKRFGLVVQQVYNAGALSLVIIMVCGFFVGGVLGLQGYSNLSKFNAEDSVGTFAAFSLVKELGPVITALVCAGRIASGIGAELGSMRVTEQIDAMEVSGTNPFKYLVVTRVLAATLMLPLLVILAVRPGAMATLPSASASGQAAAFVSCSSICCDDSGFGWPQAANANTEARNAG